VARSLPTPGSVITALLGPTNTGKTHRCVSRMLDYDSGMIGLPLRLLAREVYDRVAREAGATEVALITGEERIVPRKPRYWVCTTEAMPTQMDVDFVGVDEIQLAAHPTRGHVFTERLLHARGRFETWFLGAATMRRAIEDLVPSAHFQGATRLSKLSFTGARSLGQIPGRSAIVAFSVPQVYELAERLRVRKGGVAVVLGALSPKTRNAQVEMYQAGEVDHVVATDAIGMGLNMSIAHVALASLHKFDGRMQRALSAAELAQISGRAGRSIHDGTFGTIEPTSLDVSVAHEIENHLFPPLKQIAWRNRDLDYTSLDGLLASLHAPAPHGRLKLVHQALDTAALAQIIERPGAKPLIHGEHVVRLLWEICQIPDYRQLTPELHADLLFTIFEQVANSGHLDDDWISARLGNLDQTTGDIDTLVGRIAFVRTWTYVSQRHDWVKNASYWQQRTRDLEDALSDALHERLIARFVSRRRTSSSATSRFTDPRPTRKSPGLGGSAMPKQLGDDADDTNHPFAALRHLRVKPASSNSEPTPSKDPATWLVNDEGEIRSGGVSVAKLIAGPSVSQPRVQALTDDSGKERTALQERAQRAVRHHLETLLRGLDATEASSEVRGTFYQLRMGLGTVTTHAVSSLLDAANQHDRHQLSQAGVITGRLSVYCKRLLKPTALRQRLALARAFYAPEALPEVRRLGDVSLPRPKSVSRDEGNVAMCLGYVVTRSLWVRCDVAERALLASDTAENGGDDRELTSILGCKRAIALRVMDELRQRSGLSRAASAAESRNASRGLRP
jgi:ATP-dependent RNA helicase SUPV3L1/SUV3